MRALITGISGFTGKYVAAELEKAGYDVFGIGSHVHSGSARQRVVDLLDVEALARCVAELRPDVVVHLAAIAFVGHGNAEDFYRVNLIGTRNLLSALAATDAAPRCVLLASSANVYGNSTEGVLSESAPLNPANDYAVSKLAMEYMARLWLPKLPIVLVRPFNYTGIGQAENFLLPKIVAHFRRREATIELGNLDVWRDFSDVRAVAEAYCKLIEVCPAGEVVNVCSGIAHSLRDAISVAERVTGHQIDVRVNPAFVRANEVRSLCGDASRLRQIIGQWQAPTFEDTLRWMLTAA